MIDYVSFSGTTYNTGVQRFEAGTPNVCGAIGLATAFRYLKSINFSSADAHEKSLYSWVKEELSGITGLKEHGTTNNKAAVFSFSIEGIHPHDLATLLDAKRHCHSYRSPLLSTSYEKAWSRRHSTSILFFIQHP